MGDVAEEWLKTGDPMHCQALTTWLPTCSEGGARGKKVKVQTTGIATTAAQTPQARPESSHLGTQIPWLAV